MTPSEASHLIVDQNSPWLGLASFTEESSGFFFGREQEVAELGRRVQRKLLTILFGKSGLGKTSILQAGLVPALRAEGYFPVYIRIDYGHESLEASEQITQAINRAAAAGHWTQAKVALPGESIWEFMHHRDAVLRSPSGEKLIPLLIFDQFEELFTLAQSDEFGRTRAARLVEELADLVENRPPKALEAKLEADESAAERFDFSRSDYRVVIALREDYLAPLESLKQQMPSLSQNRLRLAPMTGSQALEAVLRPGGQLVSEEVAAAIVRFVAGGSELSNAEVEPSLLSLICRELNEQRIAQNRPEISLDLLAGSHESILISFYERALADQPAGVRRLIEDELLTESGYRENLAEERVLRRLEAAGGSADALGVLVNRRLLRIEERLDVRRVELTHDVLTGIVKSSRDQRLEREAREVTERLIAEQRDREQAARRALRRARIIAAGCTLLAAMAIVAAGLAIVNVQRARRAEEDARQTRATSEQARRQAEGLLGYLTDDFVRELESFGRYQTIAELSQREIDYFRALPAALKDPQTVRNGALALVNAATASIFLGKTDRAIQSSLEAVKLLESLRHTGDQSEDAIVTLARAYIALGEGRTSEVSPEQFTDLKRAVDLLRPVVARPNASREARRVYIEALTAFGFSGSPDEDPVQVEREAMSLALQLGADRQTDLPVDADYAIAAGGFASSLVGANRNDEARRAGGVALTAANQVLAQRPQYGSVLFAKQTTEASLAAAASNDLDPVEQERLAVEDEQTALELVALEPENTLYVSDLASAHADIAQAMWAMGRFRESIVHDRQSLETYDRLNAAAESYIVSLGNQMGVTVRHQAQVGDAEGAAASLASGFAAIEKLHLADNFTRAWADAVQEYLTAILAYQRGDFAAARSIASVSGARWQSSHPNGAPETVLKNIGLFAFSDVEGRAEYSLGRFSAAVQAERTAVREIHDLAPATSRDAMQLNIWLSMALAKNGKEAEAAQIIDPIVVTYRALVARNHGDRWLPLELAEALYAKSLTNPRQRPALLREAAQLIRQLTPSIAALRDTRAWSARIQRAQGS